ncbi:BTB/POZ domain-containing protein KCTD9-like [Pollicipes pollicipes]|uniref:BTB/POZ domain-containing protein KCTD9-like n=1 Tax=Pollicipes pollicipes TaxID=41117 RepID=UPI0018850A3D|nr:BTB/POZ domain-containing protein KCTD9-like [Pollicipes pollicipes]
MLARMFGGDPEGLRPGDRDSSGAYLIDRSPTYFEPILHYLRTRQLVLDEGVNPAGVLEEARFFGVESLLGRLEALAAAAPPVAADAPLSRREVVRALLVTPSQASLRFQGVNFTGADLSKLDLRNINFKVGPGAPRAGSPPGARDERLPTIAGGACSAGFGGNGGG